MTDMTSSPGLTGAPARPDTLTRAALLLAFCAIIDVTGPLLPGSRGEMAYGVTFALLNLTAAGGLWLQRRWGYVMTIVVSGAMVLLAVPPLFSSLSPALKSVAVVHGVASALAIVLATRPESRRAYR